MCFDLIWRDTKGDSQPPEWLVQPSGEPKVTRTGDRQELIHAGETVRFEVQADGTVAFNGSPWAKAVGYEPSEAQRRRFAATLVMALMGPARPAAWGPP